MNSEISEELVLKSYEILSAYGRVIRASIVSSKSGMSLEESKTALLELMTRYKGELELDAESGEPLFNFTFPLKRRKKAGINEVFSKFFSVLMNILLGLMKASIAIVILGLFFLYTILPMLAQRNKKRTRNNPMLYMLIPLFIETLANVAKSVFNYSGRRKIKYITNENGDKYRVLDYQPYKSQGGFSGLFKSDKNITDIAFDFVFGKKRAVYTEEEITIRALKLIAENSGFLTSGMLIKLEGYTFDEANQKLIEYSLKYSGDISFNNDGVAYSYFSEFSHFESGRNDIELIEYTDEIEPPYVLTGNTARENIMLILLMIIPAILTLGVMNDPDSIVKLSSSLEYFTIGFTLFFFGTPLIRLPFIKYFNGIISRKNRRRKLYKTIFENLKSPKIPIESITSMNFPEKILYSSVSDLKGEAVADDNGKAAFDFTWIFKEINFSGD